MDSALRACVPQKPVLISGPTAAGKSAVALALAEEQGRVIVNADALQVFEGWRIITARPNDADLARVPHLLYGHVDRRGTYSVGDWLRAVAPLLQQVPAPVIVGGTGLYFQALLNGLADIPATDQKIRALANAKLEGEGLAALVAELDIGTRAKIDLRNPMRVQRAWEVLTQTGRGLASWQAETGTPLLNETSAHAFLVTHDTPVLNDRIDRRFDAMMRHGGWDEARAMEPGWQASWQSSRAIGAAQLIGAIRGERDEAEAVAEAKLISRQFAKRQRTWMRSKMQNWTVLETSC